MQLLKTRERTHTKAQIRITTNYLGALKKKQQQNLPDFEQKTIKRDIKNTEETIFKLKAHHDRLVREAFFDVFLFILGILCLVSMAISISGIDKITLF